MKAEVSRGIEDPGTERAVRMHPEALTHDQKVSLEYTVSHFKEIARQNRFAENSAVEHDAGRCVICRAGLLPQDPFLTYLHVVVPSILARRPRLDQDLVEAINEDLAMEGEGYRVSLRSLEAGEGRAVKAWKAWIRSALATGLGLLSVHSPTSLDLDLDEAEAKGLGEAIQEKVEEILLAQQEGAEGRDGRNEAYGWKGAARKR